MSLPNVPPQASIITLAGRTASSPTCYTKAVAGRREFCAPGCTINLNHCCCLTSSVNDCVWRWCCLVFILVIAKGATFDSKRRLINLIDSIYGKFVYVYVVLSKKKYFPLASVFFFFFYPAFTTLYQSEPPHSRGFEITHKDAQQSVGLLWTSDQPVAETSTWRHTQNSQRTTIHALGRILTRNPSKPSAVDTRLRPLGHWDGPQVSSTRHFAGYRYSQNCLYGRHEGVCGSRCSSPLTLNLGTRRGEWLGSRPGQFTTT
jgi:hypothetical protein